jgi:hypothetical protein
MRTFYGMNSFLESLRFELLMAVTGNRTTLLDAKSYNLENLAILYLNTLPPSSRKSRFASFYFDFILGPEGGSSVLFRNVYRYLPEYTASYHGM